MLCVGVSVSDQVTKALDHAERLSKTLATRYSELASEAAADKNSSHGNEDQVVPQTMQQVIHQRAPDIHIIMGA